MTVRLIRVSPLIVPSDGEGNPTAPQMVLHRTAAVQHHQSMHMPAAGRYCAAPSEIIAPSSLYPDRSSTEGPANNNRRLPSANKFIYGNHPSWLRRQPSHFNHHPPGSSQAVRTTQKAAVFSRCAASAWKSNPGSPSQRKTRYRPALPAGPARTAGEDSARELVWPSAHSAPDDHNR